MELDIRHYLTKAKEQQGLQCISSGAVIVVTACESMPSLCLTSFNVRRLRSSAVSLQFNQGRDSSCNQRANSAHGPGVVRRLRGSSSAGETEAGMIHCNVPVDVDLVSILSAGSKQGFQTH